MRRFKNIKWMALLMALTIFVIAGFQVYWLSKSYQREERTMEMRTNMMFRETMRNLQAAKLKLDKFGQDSAAARMFIERGSSRERRRSMPDHKMVGMMDVLMQKAKDSTRRIAIVTTQKDSLEVSDNNISPRQNRIMQFLFDVESLQDTLRVKEIETAMQARLDEQGLEVPFTISQVPTVERERPVFNEVTLGFRNPITYRLDLGNTFPLLIQRITAPILFSFFLVGFTILSFTLLYRNLVRQRRLADIKNEFISNITHELKTPIATVSVAIEALRSFSANIDPQKTKEYLDISANELQRLSLLVDKVLKLSMFEKKEIDLKYEKLDMQDLAMEVYTSMRLQFEKKKAVVNITHEGNTTLDGDRLHLVSVIFNLLDNALKYSSDRPEINIHISGNEENVTLQIADLGIGIPPEYHGRIFEKFFRVPTGNLHNAKGYGLGLSYVSHVVEKHKGTIKVDSAGNNGTTFNIILPKHHV